MEPTTETTASPTVPATPTEVIAADEATPTTTTDPSTEKTSERKEAPKLLDLVFCMDCTGSMSSYIESAKQNIETIVQKLIAYEKCDLRFGLVAYRDHPPQDSSYITQVYEFVSSMRRMQENLNQLSASGGGDGPEAVTTGLYDCLHMPWRKDATKVVILISDAPPHGLGENGDGFPEGEPNGHDPIAIAHEMAREGITVYSVGCEPAIQSYRFARAFLCSIAEITAGQAVALSNAQLLADVILGGAIEELGLATLMAEVQQEVATITAAAEARGEALDDEAVARHVTSTMNSKGIRTKQMKTNAGMADAYACHLSKATRLSEARTNLSVIDSGSAGVPTSSAGAAGGFFSRVSSLFSLGGSSAGAEAAPSSGAVFDSFVCEEAKDSSVYCAMPPASYAASAPSAASAPMMSRPAVEEVSVTEEDISYDQVKRMVYKSKVQSLH